VAIGDPVEKGQVVAIISAMKMEMAIQVHNWRKPVTIASISCSLFRNRFQFFLGGGKHVLGSYV
jgi:hypothetical protein